YQGQAAGGSSGAASQDLFLTAGQSRQSLQSSTFEPDARERTSGAYAFGFEIAEMGTPK
ncbi:hypothetical protein KIL84_001453, partial [Mauremys mutica]